MLPGKYQHMKRNNYIHTVIQDTGNKDIDGSHIVHWLSSNSVTTRKMAEVPAAPWAQSVGQRWMDVRNKENVTNVFVCTFAPEIKSSSFFLSISQFIGNYYRNCLKLQRINKP